MSSNLWNCSYSLLPIRPPQFCYDEAKIGKILNFYSASRQGGGQSRRPSKGQIPVCAASGANTLQGGQWGGQIVGETSSSPAPPIELANAQCTWSKDARIELGEYLNIFRRYATPEIEIRALRTRLHFASFSSRRQRRRQVTPCPEAWVNTGRGWGASRKIKRQLFWVK